MRPNINISHALNGRVKDHAEQQGMSLDEAYREITEAGLEVVEQPDESTRVDCGAGLSVPADPEEVASAHYGSLSSLDRQPLDTSRRKIGVPVEAQVLSGPEMFHPIFPDVLSTVLAEYDETVDRVVQPTSDVSSLFNTILTEVQETFDQHLRSIVGAAYARDTSTIEILWEVPDYYVFGDSKQVLRQALEDDLDIGDSMNDIAEMHKRTANKLSPDHRDISIDPPVWVVLKSQEWADAQWTIDRFFTFLIESGLSPTQVIDYWMVSVLDKRPVRWAEIRGKTTNSIRNNVRTATNILEESAPTAIPSDSADPWTRVYEGVQTEEGNYVTVDGHPLYPRRDIRPYAKTGEFSWGYSGAGPHQLATALLADALGTHNYPLTIVGDFVEFLNAEIGDQQRWSLTHDTIMDWVFDQTDYFD